jgi:TIR domain
MLDAMQKHSTTMIVPKVFISYSHDSMQHKKWVLDLAIRLRNNGIDAILDQFELKPGDDIPHFMETHLADSDKILMICTENYVSKTNKGEGGVGYEKMIITSNLMKRINESKIIPIVRQNNSENVPTFLISKFYINFNADGDFEFSYDDLVRTIHNSPLFVKPLIGNNPFQPVQKEEKEERVSSPKNSTF